MSAFIYVLKCPLSGAVRYVGYTHDLKARLRQHLSEARRAQYSNHKINWIRSLLAQGLSPSMEVDSIVANGVTPKSAEVERVAFWKAQGCDLTNGTRGGDLPSPLTEEGRRILSKRASATFGTTEGRARQSELMKKLCENSDWRSARDAAAKETRRSEDYRRRRSALSKALWQNENYRARMIAARAEVIKRPEYRKKLSDSQARRFSSESERKKVAEKTRLSWAEGRRS